MAKVRRVQQNDGKGEFVNKNGIACCDEQNLSAHYENSIFIPALMGMIGLPQATAITNNISTCKNLNC